MKPLRYRATAVADLRRVARETRAKWGTEQAATYTAQLRDDIKSLREYPLRFPEFEPLLPQAVTLNLFQGPSRL